MFLSLILYIKGQAGQQDCPRHPKELGLFDCNPRALRRAGLHVPSAIKSFTVCRPRDCSRSPRNGSDKISSLSLHLGLRRVGLVVELIHSDLNFRFDITVVFTINYSFSRR
jgi:hypothetical protein